MKTFQYLVRINRDSRATGVSPCPTYPDAWRLGRRSNRHSVASSDRAASPGGRARMGSRFRVPAIARSHHDGWPARWTSTRRWRLRRSLAPMAVRVVSVAPALSVVRGTRRRALSSVPVERHRSEEPMVSAWPRIRWDRSRSRDNPGNVHRAPVIGPAPRPSPRRPRFTRAPPAGTEDPRIQPNERFAETGPLTRRNQRREATAVRRAR